VPFVFVDRDALALASFFPVHNQRSRKPRLSGLLLHAAIVLSACGTPTVADTVDLGDNPEPSNIMIDEDFFYCRIQPDVITAQRCAEGGAGDSGGCHLSQSALRLVTVPSEPRCQANRVIGAPPAEAQVNLERVRATLGVDAEASPFYRRPLGLDSHPRMIFAENSPEAELIRMWLTQGAP
jgi:hypothetical protein